MVYKRLAEILVFIQLAIHREKFVCALCGRQGRLKWVRSPSLLRRELKLEATYAVGCVCGATGSHVIEIPALVFGLLLADLAIYDTRDGVPVIEITVPAAVYANDPVSDAERHLFGLSSDDWDSFMRRLGIKTEVQS